nr:MAG TPA: hypothetical protein [Caudoviricetes sp.]
MAGIRLLKSFKIIYLEALFAYKEKNIGKTTTNIYNY